MRISVIIIFTLICHSLVLLAQPQSLIYVAGDNQMLLDHDGQLVYQVPKGYELVNSNIYQQNGMNSHKESVYYTFHGFPLLAKQESTSQFVLLYKEPGKVLYFPPNLIGVSRLNEGFYLASRKQDKGYWEATYYQFFDRNANPVFSSAEITRASEFSEGLAPVRISGKGWRYINDLGHEFKLLNDSLEHAEWVTSFHDGLSLVKVVSREKGKSNFIHPFFINKQGEVVFALNQIVGGKRIQTADEFRGGLTAIGTEWPDKPYNGKPVIFMNKHGKIVLELEDVIEYKISGTGHIAISKRDENKKYVAYLYDADGELMPIPEGIENISYVGGNYFSMSRGLGTGKAEHWYYNVALKKTMQFHPTGKCLGVFGDRLLLEGANQEKRIIDITNGEELYHSELKNMVIQNLDVYQGKLEDIEVFYCHKDEWVDQIEKMTNLKELTLHSLSIEKFPKIANAKSLRLLRIDQCKNLAEINPEINNLNKLSLRNCVKLQKVKEFVISQNALATLFIINMGIAAKDAQEMKSKVKEATIQGSIEAADYELQEVIYGF